MSDNSHLFASTIAQIHSQGHSPGRASACPIVGIWRIGHQMHQSQWASLSLAQPADALDSPRWDYVIKMASDTSIESMRQINNFVASASRVMHPNLIAVLDSSSNASSPYLVMPKLDGESMDRHLGSQPPKKLPVALWLVRQIAQAISALHDAGWIHGDIKPENSIVGARGHVTLVDLGFATRIHSIRNSLFRGTPDYAAPELLERQHAAIPAMDIFSLGKILWQWMAHVEPVSQFTLEPVADLVEAMIADKPDDRPTASEVVKRLLKLEIETLGRHIEPGKSKQSSWRAA